MKRTLLASAAAAVALIAAPALAGDLVGHVDLSYGAHDYDGENNTNVALGGALATSFDNGWTLQADGQMNQYKWDGSSSGDSFGQATVHLAKRNDQYSIGGFAGMISYYDTPGLMVGGEGQAFLSKATLSGSVGYADFDTSSDYSAWNAQGGAKYFVNDNFSLDASLGYVSFDAWSDWSGWNGGVGAEYKMAASPVSLFANYRHDEFEADSFFSDYATDTVTVGVRLNLGADTLLQRDRHGASLTGGQAMLDNFLRW